MTVGLFLIVGVAPLLMNPFTTHIFADIKLLAIAAGTAAIWLSAIAVRLDRRLVIAAGIWFGVTVVAAVFGVDPVLSFVGQATTRIGVIQIGLWAYLMVATTKTPHVIASKIPLWLAYAGCAEGLFMGVARLIPGVPWIPGNSTFGNPVSATGFLAIAMVATLGIPDLSRTRRCWMFAILGVGMGAAGQRSSLFLVIVVMLVAALLRILGAKELTLAGIVALLTAVGTWSLGTLITQVTPGSTLVDQFRDTGGDKLRFLAMSAGVKKVVARPLLGWGPDQGLIGYLHTAGPQRIQVLGRGSADAHNFLLQTTVTTGILGTLAFLAVLAIAAPKIWRGRVNVPWAVAGCIVLVIFHQYEPMETGLTTLLFVLAGISMTDERPPTKRRDLERWRAIERAPRNLSAGQLLIGACLAVSLLFTVDNMLAAGLARWGQIGESNTALRLSLALAPWQSEPRSMLAVNLASDSETVADSGAMMRSAIQSHPWDPSYRLQAAYIESYLGNPEAAQALVADHLHLFPGDSVAAHAILSTPSKPSTPIIPTIVPGSTPSPIPIRIPPAP